MTRSHVIGFVVGALLVGGGAVLVERRTGDPSPQSESPELAPALRDYRGIQTEREDRLTDSIVAEVPARDPTAAQLSRERLAAERERLEIERQRLRVEQDNNEKLLLLCRQNIDVRYCH